ncbi:hypothetical protein ELOC111193_16735 [Elizabethkingia occulta]
MTHICYFVVHLHPIPLHVTNTNNEKNKYPEAKPASAIAGYRIIRVKLYIDTE